MSEPDYMTGEELRNVMAAICGGDFYSGLNGVARGWWDRFAERIKCPRPKKPPTMFAVYRQWQEDGGYTTKSTGDIEDLRQRLNEAREAIDAYEAGRKP